LRIRSQRLLDTVQDLRATSAHLRTEAALPRVCDVCGDRSPGWQPLTQRRPARWAHWRCHALLLRGRGHRTSATQPGVAEGAAVSALARACLLHARGAPSHATLHPRRIRDAMSHPPARIDV
jgi:hypothetical protein